MLQITFYLRPPLFTSRRFYYFFAHFNVRTMIFTEPVFFVPSTFVHRHARRGERLRRGAMPFQIKASLGPDAHDEWTPYRLRLAELGPHIVKILKELGTSQAASLRDTERLEDGVIVLAMRRRPRQRQRLRPAA